MNAQTNMLSSRTIFILLLLTILRRMSSTPVNVGCGEVYSNSYSQTVGQAISCPQGTFVSALSVWVGSYVSRIQVSCSDGTDPINNGWGTSTNNGRTIKSSTGYTTMSFDDLVFSISGHPGIGYIVSKLSVGGDVFGGYLGGKTGSFSGTCDVNQALVGFGTPVISYYPGAGASVGGFCMLCDTYCPTNTSASTNTTATGSVCLPCPIGTFTEGPGQTTCKSIIPPTIMPTLVPSKPATSSASASLSSTTLALVIALPAAAIVATFVFLCCIYPAVPRPPPPPRSADAEQGSMDALPILAEATVVSPWNPLTRFASARVMTPSAPNISNMRQDKDNNTMISNM